MVCWLTFTGHITVADNVAFALDSKASDSRLIFTLTCISTGGPATTVTWTRDSDTVTEGTETVLDDPVTAQYTHTLTVTGRLGGLYTCTVANDKPSNDSAQFTVQGKLLYEDMCSYIHICIITACIHVMSPVVASVVYKLDYCLIFQDLKWYMYRGVAGTTTVGVQTATTNTVSA